MSTVRVISSFATTYEVSWPFTFKEFFLRFLSVVNIDIGSLFALQCKVAEGYSFYAKFWMTLAQPVVCLALYQISKKLTFIGIFVKYPLVSRRVFEVFDCHNLDNTESWLKSDMAVDCNSTEHATYMLIGLASVALLPVGIPLAFWLRLFRNRKAITHPSHPKQEEVTERFAFILEDYKPECWYWEALDMMRKLLLTSVLVLVQPGTLLQIGAAVLVAVVFNNLQMRKQPYALEANNRLKFATDSQIIITLIVSLILKAASGDSSSDNLGADAATFNSGGCQHRSADSDSAVGVLLSR